MASNLTFDPKSAFLGKDEKRDGDKGEAGESRRPFAPGQTLSNSGQTFGRQPASRPGLGSQGGFGQAATSPLAGRTAGLTGGSQFGAGKAVADKPTSLYTPRTSRPLGTTGPGAGQAGRAGEEKRPFSSLRSNQPPAGAARPALGGQTTGLRPGLRPQTTGQTGQTGLAGSKQDTGSRLTFLRQQNPGTERPKLQPGSAFRPRDDAGQAQAGRAASPFRKDLQITNEEFILLRDFIYEQCGIFIAENRKYLVENRLSNRLKELNLKSYNEYYNFLRFDASRKGELTKLFEVVTTNETSFFRNPPQLDIFRDVVLAHVIDNCRKAGQKKIRIWSAGCSTGEEPYTLAIIIMEALKSEIRSWDIKITANDLSEAVLNAAKRGLYNDYALRTTPKEIAQAYFTRENNLYKLNPDVKRLVNFGQINLSDREQLKKVERSQVVFCRNVIIYFDDEMKRKVINAFYDNLEPDGVLLIGHSESLHNISRAFQLEHHKGTIVYRKMA